MKILKIYENIIREEEVGVKTEFCIKAFGKELFGDELGGTEKNTETEKDYVEMIKLFTSHQHGAWLKKGLISALNNLKSCTSQYPEILHTEGKVYRGTRVPFKVIFDNVKNFDGKAEMNYTYNSNSIVQSWSEDKLVGMEYSYGSNYQKIPSGFKNFVNVKDNYKSMSDKEKIKFLGSYLDREPVTGRYVPVMLEVDASTDDFLFKAKYFRIISEYQQENEILRISNRPLNCILSTNPLFIFFARELHKYYDALGLDDSDFEEI